MTTWLITGANGNLGRRLISCLLGYESSDDSGDDKSGARSDEGSEQVGDRTDRVKAVVRSKRAAAEVARLVEDDTTRDRLDIVVTSYSDQAALTEAARGCDVAVHLVGILKEGSTSTYVDAHENSCGALAGACRESGVGCIVYLSIVGAAAQSSNQCLASKGRAEVEIHNSGVAACVLRVPMVLGEGDYASRALYARAIKPRSFAFRAESLEQPVYAGDVVRAIVNAATHGVVGALDLGGPEVVSRRALTERAATHLGTQTKVVSLPVGLGLVIASVMAKLSANPPVTPAMLGVLDHDDDVDSERALIELRLGELVSLDEMLRRVVVAQTRR